MSLDFVELKRTLESLNAPLGAGEVFYVCPESDSWFSDFVGIQKVSGQVHGSIQKAVDACVSGRGDTIVVLPGTYTYSTAALAVNKDGVTIMGLPGKLELTNITTGVQSVGTGGWNTIDVSGQMVTISGINVSNGCHNATVPTKDVIYATGQGFTLKDSLVSYATNEGSALRGVVLRASHCKVLNTRFDNCITGGSALFLDVAGGTLRNPLIEGCSFVGVNKNADSNFCIGAAATSPNEIYGLLIKGCTFDPSGTGGGGGEDMLQLINAAGSKSYEGIIVDCIFGVDVSAAGEMGNIGATLRLAGCFGTNDVSKGQPA